MATNKTEHSGSRSFLQRVRLHATVKLLAAFVLISSLIGYVMFQSFFRQSRLEPVQATIRASRLDPCPDGMFTVDIRFAYTVNRIPYKSDMYRDDFGKLCLKEEEAKAILHQYPVGAQVEAWFDPKHPRYAVLDRSMGTMQKGFLIVTGGFLGILFLAILFSRKSRSRQHDSQSIASAALILSVCLMFSGCGWSPPVPAPVTGGDYGPVTPDMLAGATFNGRTGRDRSYDDLQWTFQDKTFLITAGKNGLPPVLASRLLPEGMEATEISGQWSLFNDVITFTEIKADGNATDQPPRTLDAMFTGVLRIEAGSQYKFLRKSIRPATPVSR